MGIGPPSAPEEGQRWRSGRDVYLFQQGKGWVDARLYKPPPKLDERWSPPICSTCGGPRSIISATGLCRPCYYATKRKPKAEPVAASCSICGGPRSPLGKTGKCRACFTAEQSRLAAERPKPDPRCIDCGGPVSPFSKRCRDCYTGQTQARPIEPPPALPPAPAAAPPPPAPRPVEARLPPAPRHYQPARAPAPDPDEEEIALPCRRDERVEIITHGPIPLPPDPFAHREREPKAPPAFSPEFLAKLAKVAAGAGIADVKAVPSRTGLETGAGSSLGGII